MISFKMNSLPSLQVNNCNESSLEFCDAPYLKIVEQPQTHHKFRYKSEMESSHGCLYGNTYVKNKTPKTYPEVELVNFNDKARITCSLIQVDSLEEHPHKLHSNEEDQDFFADVPESGSYNVRFPGLCIVHTSVKKVQEWLYKQHCKDDLSVTDRKKIQSMCANKANKINMNVIRLKFTAVDLNTGELICEPVFSEPIHNLKNPATNVLKICKMSQYTSRATGGDDIIMLVEKVIKKNIKIRFFQLSEDGVEVWASFANFLENEVHHQYAISFRTPPYKDVNTKERVDVFVELVRTTDGKTSAPMKFCYIPKPFFCNGAKRRKTCENFDTPPCTPSSSCDRELRDHNKIQPAVEISQFLNDKDPLFTQFKLDGLDNYVSPNENSNETLPVEKSYDFVNFNIPLDESPLCLMQEQPSMNLNLDDLFDTQENLVQNVQASDISDFDDFLRATPLENLFNADIMDLLVPDSSKGSQLSSDSGGDKSKTQKRNENKTDSSTSMQGHDELVVQQCSPSATTQSEGSVRNGKPSRRKRLLTASREVTSDTIHFKRT